MPSAYVKAIGLVELLDFLALAKKAVDQIGEEKWWVISVVKYGAKYEFGVGTPARPHWRVAIKKVADKYHLDIKGEQALMESMAVGGGLTRKIAEALRAQVRREIMAQGLFDSGNYYGSIGIGRTKEEAIADSKRKLIRPDTAASL